MSPERGNDLTINDYLPTDVVCESFCLTWAAVHGCHTRNEAKALVAREWMIPYTEVRLRRAYARPVSEDTPDKPEHFSEPGFWLCEKDHSDAEPIWKVEV